MNTGKHPAPSEADGWRVVQDPFFTSFYYRYRALQLEVSIWYPWDAEWAVWEPVDSGWFNIHPGAAERRALWAELFFNP